MGQQNSAGKLIGFIGLISSLIGIYAFLSGNQSLHQTAGSLPESTRVSTSTPITEPLVRGQMSSWGIDRISQHIGSVNTFEDNLSNAEFSEEFFSEEFTSAQIFTKIAQDFKRSEGYRWTYQNETGCEVVDSASIFFTSIEYSRHSTQQDALMMLEFLRDVEQYNISVVRSLRSALDNVFGVSSDNQEDTLSFVSNIGSQAFKTTFNGGGYTFCQVRLNYGRLMFVRNNVVAIVTVWGQDTPFDLGWIADDIAQRVDLRLTSLSQ